MYRILHLLVSWITRAHSYILTLNDRYQTNFTDKELHFLVIGLVGLALILLIYPLFKWLANRKRVLAITWIYVVTVLLVMTFAIEIGQGFTGTGTMEFKDVMAGMGGFFVVTAVIEALRILIWIIRSIACLARGEHRTERSGHRIQTANE